MLSRKMVGEKVEDGVEDGERESWSEGEGRIMSD